MNRVLMCPLLCKGDSGPNGPLLLWSNIPKDRIHVRVMGERVDNMKSNENQVKYRTFDARFNSTIFSMIHGISAVLFKILKIWSRRSWKIMLGWFVWIFCWFNYILLPNFSVDDPKLVTRLEFCEKLSIDGEILSTKLWNQIDLQRFNESCWKWYH